VCFKQFLQIARSFRTFAKQKGEKLREINQNCVILIFKILESQNRFAITKDGDFKIRLLIFLKQPNSKPRL
jgi:hypothetical protein